MISRLLALVHCLLLGEVCMAAAPPPHKSSTPFEPDPEPPRLVYHHFTVYIQGDKLSAEQMCKLVAPLKVARFQVLSFPRTFKTRRGLVEVPGTCQFYVRTRKTYAATKAVILAKPGVIRVTFPKTVTKLPVLKISVGLPLDAPHHPDCPAHQQKKR